MSKLPFCRVIGLHMCILFTVSLFWSKFHTHIWACGLGLLFWSRLYIYMHIALVSLFWPKHTYRYTYGFGSLFWSKYILAWDPISYSREILFHCFDPNFILKYMRVALTHCFDPIHIHVYTYVPFVESYASMVITLVGFWHAHGFSVVRHWIFEIFTYMWLTHNWLTFTRVYPYIYLLSGTSDICICHIVV